MTTDSDPSTITLRSPSFSTGVMLLNIGNALESLIQTIPDMEANQVTDLFVYGNQLSDLLKRLDTEARKGIQTHKAQAGSDEKGSLYFSGEVTSGVKLERRVSMSLVPNAKEILRDTGYLDLFPRVFDPQTALVKLRSLGIRPVEYTEPEVNFTHLETLVESGLVPNTVAVSLIESKESFAFKVQKQK